MNDLTNLIRVWAVDRGLDQADPTKQMLKLIEEVGELASSMNKSNRAGIVDGIGDAFVVLVVLSLQLDLDITHCVQMAYDEIKNRKGRMVNGVFVKESDLG